MTLGCDAAYRLGWNAYYENNNSEPPEDLSKTEEDLWQAGFDAAAVDDITGDGNF